MSYNLRFWVTLTITLGIFILVLLYSLTYLLSAMVGIVGLV